MLTPLQVCRKFELELTIYNIRIFEYELIHTIRGGLNHKIFSVFHDHYYNAVMVKIITHDIFDKKIYNYMKH